MPGSDRTPFATYALLAANISVFALMARSGGPGDPLTLERFGALFGPLIAEGQYWRLLTAMFLHAGLAHLAFNGLGLLIYGAAVERIFGPWRMLTIYAASGLLGSAFSYLANPGVYSVGASGAIFGTLGALVAHFVTRKDEFGKLGQREVTIVLFLAAMNLLTGLTTPGIDNWAHVGGFAGGIALGLALAPLYAAKPDSFGGAQAVISRALGKKWLVAPAVVAVALLGAALATVTLPDNPYSHIYEAERRFEQGDLVLALVELDKAIAIDQLNGDAHLLRGRIYAQTGNIEAALAELGIALNFGHPNTRKQALELIPKVRANQGLNR